MIIREYKPSDMNQIAELFFNCVHNINSRDYTKQQLNAWATGEINKSEWNKSFLEHYTLVVENDSIILGFGDIDDTGYLDRLYVHKDYQALNIATMLCNKLEKRFNTPHITVHSSITAKGFFEKRGYIVIKEQQVKRSGQILTNFIMQKDNNIYQII